MDQALESTVGDVIESVVGETVDTTVDEITTHVNRIQQYFMDQVPSLTRFCVKILLAIAALYIGRKIINWILKFVRHSMEHANIDTGAIQFIHSVLKFALYAVLIINISISFGVKESSVAALLGTAGVTVGLALQGGLADMVGGMIILIFKPFQVGDYIISNQQNGCEGTVYKIEICYTTLLTIDNKHIVVPNGTLSGSTITNVTAQAQRKLEIKVGISYDSNLIKAKEILLRLLREDPDVIVNEDTIVFVDELGQSSVVIGFRSWVATDKYWPAKWRLNQRIKEVFDAQGVVICYNQLDVHIHQ
jgi:small conductance mechanosensitive channel